MSKKQFLFFQQQTIFKNKGILVLFTPYSNLNNEYDKFANKFCHLIIENLTKHSNN